MAKIRREKIKSTDFKQHLRKGIEYLKGFGCSYILSFHVLFLIHFLSFIRAWVRKFLTKYSYDKKKFK